MKASRRKFIALAGSTLVTLPMSASETDPKPAAGRPRSQHRFPAIDCQSHLFCPEIVALMEKRKAEPFITRSNGERYVQMGAWRRKILPKHLDIAAKLADMDANGIATTALSINDPGPEWFGSEGAAVARLANDFIAGVVHQHPGRFLGLCVLPLQDERAAQAELERCAKQLGTKGILLYTNLAGRFPDEPQFRWLFARAVELDLPVLLHPAKPITTEQVKGYEMISALGNMFEDTIALTRLIMSGVLDQFPKLRLVCPHLGGTLPYIIGRLDHQMQVLKRGPKYLTRAPSEYLKAVWLDIVSPLPGAMRLAYDLMGPERLLYASDHPWVAPGLILSALRRLNLPAADEAKILGGNARTLFGL